ncbi:MAG: signal recognition particle protein [Oscillospiraceae bacterium]|jgi:signal recognition particle subunit SRP54|nr:signal recognition particle protein [Oscillospiraceae bacterium]
MAFESLGEKLQAVFKKLRGKGRLSEADVRETMRAVRLALLEADVSFKVVKDFTDKVSERCVGAAVLESLNPAQTVVKAVNEELTALLGGEAAKLNISPKPPSAVMLIGLQGAGKTTNGAKLAGLLKKQGKRPLLVACDIYRPAAITQLQIVGSQLGVPVYSEEGATDPAAIAARALEHAKRHGNDYLLLDTAGRLHIDEALMDELRRVKDTVRPCEIMLVVDAMTGQDAVNVASAFHGALGLTGVLLSKLDGDVRGGAALSVRAVTGCPVKYCGMGERLDKIEVFHPERMASRILGMGDMLTLIEKAERGMDAKKAEEMERRLRQGKFTLDDYVGQLAQVKGMGSIADIAGMIPGMDKHALKNAKFDEKALSRAEAILLSMTKHERENPEVLNSSRKRRVAAGSGTRVEDINKMLRQYEMMRQLTKQLASGKIPKGLKGFGF